MPSSNRRRFLGVAGTALTGLAGCAGDLTTDSDGTTTETSTTDTTTPTDTSTTSDGTSTTSEPESSERTIGDVVVDVTDATVRKAVAYESAMGSGGVIAPDGQQFVVAAVRSGTTSETNATGAPSYDSFDLVVDGETYSPIYVEDRTTGGNTTSLAGRGEIPYDSPYANSYEVGWVAFELPSPVDASAVAVRCRYGGETAEWTLSDDQVDALGRPAPEFELRSFEATPNESSVDISLVVENVSETDGRFLAAVYWPTARIADDDESTIVDRSVDAGGRVEWTQTFDTEYAGGGDSEGDTDAVTASVDGPVTAERTVELDSGTTTSN
ncbi:hypothetical protein [Halomicrococcus gelatinilyticus]|uniref:hypothetical protein n=1 Tax=Halomicrococcus gelatinilyticus TaxID=1702103 RepID=UPI002E125920